MTTKDIQPDTIRAHELYGDFWFNSEPVPISALGGRVILIHFWDYTCVHCLRGLPYMKEWQKKYEQHGLVTVGVHTPKFPFAKNPVEVQRMIHRLDITYPVVMDNGYIIASQYGNRIWPTTYVIDKNGCIRHQNAGEGHYENTEHVIQTLLYDAGVDRELPGLMRPLRDEDKHDAMCFRVTPELFAGYMKGTLGNVEGYSPEFVVDYHDPQIYIEGRLYANGPWLNEKNSLRLSQADGTPGHIVLSYLANEVSAVVKPEGETGFEVELMQDEKFLNDLNKGDDVRIGPDGRSYFCVDEPRVFHLVKNGECGEHILKLTTSNNGFALYSFMFGSCIIPEMISNN